MNDDQYRQHCLGMLGNFNTMLAKEAESCSDGDPLRELSSAFDTLAELPDMYEQAGPLVHRLFSSCPQLAPLFPRELLWFFGGDCLHLMPDEEIALYQNLDEQRLDAAANGDLLDYHGVRANLLKLQ